MNSIVADLIFALVISVTLMFITWLIAVKIKNAGIVDIAWSAGFTLLTLVYYWITDGWIVRKILISLIVMSWSMRLAIHLFKRIRKEHPVEDARYVEMRNSFGGNADLKFLAFFQIQALVLCFLSVPFCLIAENPRENFEVFEICGFVFFLFALGGEWLADRQLLSFKKDSKTKGQVCQIGLWRYSRHPNYFFEWLVWVAFFIMACSSEYGVWTVYCPLLMLFFLLKVSGVPLAEKQSLQSKGDKYRQYQATTNEFFPWFRKEA
jgi:steroid 5-alpha reductase family enzyme